MGPTLGGECFVFYFNFEFQSMTLFLFLFKILELVKKVINNNVNTWKSRYKSKK